MSKRDKSDLYQPKFNADSNRTKMYSAMEPLEPKDDDADAFDTIDDDMDSIKELLNSYTAPEPTYESTRALAATLENEMDRLYGLKAKPSARRGIGINDLLRALAMQMHFYPIYVWLAATVILLSGTILTASMVSIKVNIMIALVPWLGSLLTLYGASINRGVWGELQAISPISTEVAILGRWLAATVINAAAATLVSGISVLAGWEDSFIMLALSWLIPLLLSTALALALTLRFGIGTAFGASVLLWAIELTAGNRLGPVNFIGQPGSYAWVSSRWIGTAVSAALMIWVWFMLRNTRYRNGAKPKCM
ncbi:hypothetical protein [Mahella sp.]|uniref:hypothetical protein n=1 Tax=Mahella sp. TaxID=2798721 RepID=UPI0025BE913B|nr:hypothetical protein [Mahella sp.]MBZ4664839.1 hypothetical protein [Mahella sp.]